MQLKRFGKGLKPVSLVAVLLPNTGVAYSDVDGFSAVDSSSKRTEEYLQVVDNTESGVLFSKMKFRLHFDAWRAKTRFLSSAHAIVADSDFQAIVAMGKPVVPFILEELQAQPSTLVWALNYIYGQKISSNPRLTVTEACKLWTKRLI